MTLSEAEYEIEQLSDYTLEEIQEMYGVDTVEQAKDYIMDQVDEEEECFNDGLSIWERNGFRNMADYDRFRNG